MNWLNTCRAYGQSNIAFRYPAYLQSEAADRWTFLKRRGVKTGETCWYYEGARVLYVEQAVFYPSFRICTSEQEVRDYIAESLAVGRSGIAWAYPQSCAGLMARENVWSFLRSCGVDDASVYPNDDARVVSLENLRGSAGFVECADEDAVSRLLANARESGSTGLTFRYPQSMASRLSAEGGLVNLLRAHGIDSYTWVMDESARVVKLTDVTYFPHFTECATEAEILALVTACKAAGYTEFTFRYPQSMAGWMTTDADVVAELYRIGLSSFRWSRYEDARVVRVTGVAYYPVMYTCDTVRQVVAQVQDCSERLVPAFAIVLPRDGSVQMDHDDWREIFSNNCFWSYVWSAPEGTGVMYIEKIKYRPGYAAARKAAMGRLQDMTTTERRLYDLGAQVVSQARQEGCAGLLEYEVYLHDYIAANVRYELAEEGSFHDTAEGALLYGVAECDGYSDAFYLLCSLAGLEVGFQHGDTIDSADDSTHLWNTIRINGRWFFVDMTWDDVDDDTYDTLNTYRYMNVGPNFMPSHIYNRELSNVQVQDGFDWDNFVYTAEESSLLPAAVFTETPGQWFTEWKRGGRRVVHVMIPGVITSDDFTRLVRMDYNGGTAYYRYEFNGNTIFDVYLK